MILFLTSSLESFHTLIGEAGASRNLALVSCAVYMFELLPSSIVMIRPQIFILFHKSRFYISNPVYPNKLKNKMKNYPKIIPAPVSTFVKVHMCVLQVVHPSFLLRSSIYTDTIRFANPEVLTIASHGRVPGQELLKRDAELRLNGRARPTCVAEN